MGCHVSGKVVSLSEVLVADGAGEFLFSSPPHLRFGGKFLLVVRPHVKHKVRGHAEGQVTFGAPVLH